MRINGMRKRKEKKNNLVVEWEYVETPDADKRLARVVEMLITEKDLYGDDAHSKQGMARSSAPVGSKNERRINHTSQILIIRVQ